MAAKKILKDDERGAGSAGFSAEERRAMQERAKELKAEQRASASAKEGDADVLAKIVEMPDADRVIAERIHALVKRVAPILVSRTWYGMPAYAKDGNVVCFVQGSHKFKTRYLTLGFSDKAKLDEGTMWATSFAIAKLDADGERVIEELVKRAVG